MNPLRAFFNFLKQFTCYLKLYPFQETKDSAMLIKAGLPMRPEKGPMGCRIH